MAARLRVLWPAMVALLIGGGYAVWRLSQAGWDAVALAELPGVSPSGAETGYDGQFAYFIALDPNPAAAAGHLDVPAYRYQRILFPLLARAVALGRPEAIAWALIGLNVLAHVVGTAVVAAWFHDRGMWPGYALTYAGWVGLVSGVGLDLHEPLAFALVAAAWLASARGRGVLAGLLMGAALFAKETSLLFWAAMLLGELATTRRRAALASLLAVAMLYAAWQVWLRATFGAFGLASGGAMATAFEWIPWMGLWRIGTISLPALALFAGIFGPTVVLPSLWGVLAALQAAWRGRLEAETWGLLFNAAAVVFLPFSTFREPLGLVRFASGLVLATLLFAGRGGALRPLRYSFFWGALLALLISQ